MIRPGSQNDRVLQVLADGEWLVAHPNRADILARAAAFPAADDIFQVRWLSKVEITESCWLWTGGKHWYGHGAIAIPRTRKKAYAHRLAYQWFVGEIPSHLEIDHVCRNPPCVNPTHLEAVTHRENVRRGRVSEIFGSRTHCSNGHPFVGENVRPRSDGNGRLCLTCARERSRRHREKLGVEERRERWRAEYHRRKAAA